jgi:2'-5' RNA ligase
MSEPRLFFAVMPPPEMVADIAAVVRRNVLDLRLGDALFAPQNWHQSLSERVFSPTRADIALLRAVGDHVRAHACTVQYNRIEGSRNAAGHCHVTLRAKGRPKAFDALVEAVQMPLAAAGYSAMVSGVTPHTTLSYRAPLLIDKVELEPMLEWTMDAFMLVLGTGDPYRYDILDRWTLQPERDPPVQQFGLF